MLLIDGTGKVRVVPRCITCGDHKILAIGKNNDYWICAKCIKPIEDK